MEEKEEKEEECEEKEKGVTSHLFHPLTFIFFQCFSRVVVRNIFLPIYHLIIFETFKISGS